MIFISPHVICFALKGVEFLDTVWLISMQRQWNSDALKEECRKWFSLLLKAVEIKKGVESILGMLLASSKAVTFAKDCRPHIEAEVCMYKTTLIVYSAMDNSVKSNSRISHCYVDVTMTLCA